MYDSRRLRGWNLFSGGSLVTFASILVLLQAKREGDDYVLASFIKFMLCMTLAGCASGTVVEPFWWRLSSHVCSDFGSPPSETGGW